MPNSPIPKRRPNIYNCIDIFRYRTKKKQLCDRQTWGEVSWTRFLSVVRGVPVQVSQIWRVSLYELARVKTGSVFNYWCLTPGQKRLRFSVSVTERHNNSCWRAAGSDAMISSAATEVAMSEPTSEDTCTTNEPGQDEIYSYNRIGSAVAIEGPWRIARHVGQWFDVPLALWASEEWAVTYCRDHKGKLDGFPPRELVQEKLSVLCVRTNSKRNQNYHTKRCSGKLHKIILAIHIILQLLTPILAFYAYLW